MSVHPSSRHRSWSRLVVALLLVFVAVGCNATTPTSPNMPASLDGQNPNEDASFSGSITLFGGGSGTADGVSDVPIVIEVRDRQGNPAQNFTPVTVSTTLGTVRAPGDDPDTAGSSVQVASFGGQAQVLVRSTSSGIAQVTAWIADVASTAFIQFEAGPSTDVINLAFRVGGSDSTTVEGNSPFLAAVIATVTDEDGALLSGRQVRFRIVSNSADASLTGPVRSLTDSNGEAANVLRTEGIGTVSLEADLFDANGDIVAESNQIIATITNAADDYEVTLTFADESTTTAIAPGGTIGMMVEVRDRQTSETLAGRRVRFRIVSDTAETDPAELANTSSTLTDGDGVASNAITGYELDTRVVIVVDVLDSSGFFLAGSNQIVLAIEEEAEEDDA